jgi:hypothetical protein
MKISRDEDKLVRAFTSTMVPILVLAALSVAASGQQAGAAQRADYYHVVEVS